MVGNITNTNAFYLNIKRVVLSYDEHYGEKLNIRFYFM